MRPTRGWSTTEQDEQLPPAQVVEASSQARGSFQGLSKTVCIRYRSRRSIFQLFPPVVILGL